MLCSTLIVSIALRLLNWPDFRIPTFSIDHEGPPQLVFLHSSSRNATKTLWIFWYKPKQNDFWSDILACEDGLCLSTPQKNMFEHCSQIFRVPVHLWLQIFLSLLSTWVMLYQSCLEDLKMHRHPVFLKPILTFDKRKLVFQNWRFFEIRKHLFEKQICWWSE